MFKLLKTDGSSYSILHSFAFNFVDGGNPFASLILDDAGFLYGTNFNGGNGDGGTISSSSPDGTTCGSPTLSLTGWPGIGQIAYR